MSQPELVTLQDIRFLRIPFPENRGVCLIVSWLYYSIHNACFTFMTIHVFQKNITRCALWCLTDSVFVFLNMLVRSSWKLLICIIPENVYRMKVSKWWFTWMSRKQITARRATTVICVLQTGLRNMTTAVAVEHVILRELLRISGVGVGM